MSYDVTVVLGTRVPVPEDTDEVDSMEEMDELNDLATMEGLTVHYVMDAPDDYLVVGWDVAEADGGVPCAQVFDFAAPDGTPLDRTPLDETVLACLARIGIVADVELRMWLVVGE